jgi:superfamily II DNA/RNA helicase
LLITTDLLARGYDNREVHLVINLDIPKIHRSEEPNYETYMHRVGRTGRFGDSGVALNIVDKPEDLERLEKIKNRFDLDLEEIKLKDLDKLLEEVEFALN